MDRPLFARTPLPATALMAALALLLSACGAGTGEPAGDLSREDAVAFQEFAQQSVQYQMSVLSSPESLLADLGATGITPAQPTCVETTGGATDSDSDGVPDSVGYTWTCTEDQDGFEASGSASLTDTGNGVEMDFSDLEFGVGGSSFGFDGFVSTSASHPTYTADIAIVFTFAGGGESGSFAYELDQTFTSTQSAANAFDAGTLAFTGSIDVTSDGESYGLDASSDGLVVDATCQTGVASGSTTYEDSEGNALVVVYGCDSVTATYNGAQLAALD